MSTIVEKNSLFEIDAELDSLLDEIDEQAENEGEPSVELVTRFQRFCCAHDEKVDRIGRFLRQMEARELFCRAEAQRLSDRARAAAGKVERTKNMVLYYLMSRDLRKIEGREFTRAPRRTARSRFGSLTSLEYRNRFAGSKLASTASSGKRFWRIFPTNSAKC